ncbi:MAG: GspE/PulE/PilB domain-containing protein [Planctomycetota bacterium]|jgi:hypothetical protein
MNIPKDQVGRARLLERACGDEELRASLSPEAASAFGAFPIGTEEERLVVAVPRWADVGLYALLGAAIGRPVVPVVMEGELVMGYIGRVYLEGEFPNFHTFADPGFVNEENLPLLVSGKIEPLPDPSMEVDDETLLLLDLDLTSDLANLERHEGDVKFHAGSQAIPFSRVDGGWRLYGPAPDDDVRILLKMSYLYGGMEQRHGFRGEAVAVLPVALHPTELQLVGAGPGPEARFWVFDGTREVRPGATAPLSCTYHFLNFGNRYRRTLTLRLLGAAIAAQETMLFDEGEVRWTLEDFDRWFPPA